ncbi:MAG: hypothetical protein ABIH82_03265 [Candidatus Woesearchaeota archaeon]
MINQEDQENILRLISNTIKQDLTCYAFGGNAMMFYGYKDETKDVDILFEREEEREEFIRALKFLGYDEISPIKIYLPEKLKDKHKPLMFKRDDERFDLFFGKIFHTVLSPKMKEDLFAVHEFKGKYSLTVKVLRKEHLVLLKAVTERENDFRDIRTIVETDKQFDWQYFIDEVLWQSEHGNSWALLDVKRMMTELKEFTFIPTKIFDKFYKK